LPLADAQARPVAAAGTAAADALAVLEAVTAGLRAQFGGLDRPAAHEVAGHLTGGLLLAPVVNLRTLITQTAADFCLTRPVRGAFWWRGAGCPLQPIDTGSLAALNFTQSCLI
jgi:hypothetical protein